MVDPFKVFWVLTNSTYIVTKFIRIGIADRNESAPFFDKLIYEADVDENEDIGNIVLNVTAKAHNESSTIRYEITGGNLGNAFDVNNATGSIYVASKLDYETRKKYELRLDAIEKQNRNSTTVVINVKDINDNPPVFQKQSYKTQITEEDDRNLPRSILQVTATDADVDRPQNIVYFLTGQGIDTDNPENSKFEIDRNTGEIYILKPLDRDPPNGRPLWRFTVFAQDEDGEGLVGYADVQINLKDINDNPPFFPEDVYAGNVTENGTAGVVVMTITAVDYDDPAEGSNAKITYSIEKNVVEEETGLSIFDIDPNNGLITTALCCLDRERTSEYTLQIIATDGGGLKGTGTARIRVEDVNDMPPVFTKPEWFAEVDETIGDVLPDHPILTVTVHDEDETNNFSYKIVKNSGFGDDKFTIAANSDGSGIIKINKSLDYEDLLQSNGFRFQIEVSDGADEEHHARAWVVIKLRDINDNDPIFERDSLEITVSEDVEVGKSLVRFFASDPDKNGRSLVSYFIDKASNKHKHFSIDSRGVVTVQKHLDREKNHHHQIKILAVDDGAPARTSTGTLVVNVKDVNDNAPRFLENYNPIVMEHMGPTKIAEVSAVDDDDSNVGNGAPFEFWLDPEADEKIRHSFMVEDNSKGANGQGTAVVRSLRSFDREQQKEFLIPIMIRDSGRPHMTGTQTLVVTIGDINDNRMSDGTKDVLFYNHKGRQQRLTEVGRVYVKDLDDWDLSDKKFYWDGPESARFKLNESTGMIYASQDVLSGTYHLHFKVYDRRFQQTASAGVNVVVKDLPPGAVSNAASLRLDGITDEEFVRTWDYKLGDLKESKLEKFRKKIGELVKTSSDNVDVFSVQLQNKKPPRTDVHFSVHIKSDYLQATMLNGLMMIQQEELENDVGISITMIGIDECLEDNQSCDGSCRNNLIISALSYLVNTNRTSLVGPKLIVKPECKCRAKEFRSIEACKGEDRCSSSMDSLQNHRRRSIGFRGNGWAWYPPLEVCDKNHLQIDFLTLKPNGVLVYNGPLASRSRFVNTSSDFLLVDLQKGSPRVLLNYGFQTVELFVKVKKGLNDGDWHHLDIFWDTERLRILVDYCRYADFSSFEDGSTLNTSACESSKTIPFFYEYLNVNTPMQLGGIGSGAFEPQNYLWSSAIRKQFFDGCIKNVKMNSLLIDLNKPALSENIFERCPHMEEACQKFQETIGCGEHGDCSGNVNQAECQCHPSWTGLNCTFPTIPTSFRPHSYIKYALSFEPERFTTEIQLKFRTRQKNGELFRIADQNNREYALLEIKDSLLHFRYNLNGARLEETHLTISEVKVNDGLWHLVKGSRYGSLGIVELDNGEGVRYNSTYEFVGHQFLQIDKQEGVFVGGKVEFTGVRTFEVISDFQNGCLDDIRLNSKHLPLPPATNGTQWGQATVSKNIDRRCTSRTSCTRTTCPEPFICIDLWNAHDCRCEDGQVVSSDMKECVDQNECLDTPCMNGGCCVNLDLPRRYKCICQRGFRGQNCEIIHDEHTVKLSLEALSAILICLFIIFVFVSVFVFYSRSHVKKKKKKKPPSPENDVRENVISYDDEGGGEDDMTAFDIAPLQIPVNKSKTEGSHETMEMTDLRRHEILNIETLVKDYKDRNDDDYSASFLDDLRNYAFEGPGSNAESLSPIISS
ncbi:neural-cadherin-like [Rhynchophorus ferrugineus]|uniref:neural-cadherin-like n=1 Tax=Rhynchophorus ferrugineus TaxID=354439 RepID=UPI003FCD2389